MSGSFGCERDDRVGAFGHGLGAAVAVEVGRGVSGVDGVDADVGQCLGVLVVSMVSAAFDDVYIGAITVDSIRDRS